MNLKSILVSFLVFTLIIISLFGEGELLPRIAIFDFQDENNQSFEHGCQLSALISAELSKRENLSLLERTELGKILEEHQLSLMSFSQIENNLKTSNLNGADYILVGRMYLLDNQVIVNTKLVATRSGRVFGSTFSSNKSKIKDSLPELSRMISGMVAENIKFSIKRQKLN